MTTFSNRREWDNWIFCVDLMKQITELQWQVLLYETPYTENDKGRKIDKNIKQLQPFVLWFIELEVILQPQTLLELGHGCISNITWNWCINVSMWCIPLQTNIFFQLMVKVGHLSHLKRAPGSQEWAAASTRADKGGPPTAAGPVVTQTPSGLAVSMDLLLEGQTNMKETGVAGLVSLLGRLWCLFWHFNKNSLFSSVTK